MKEYQIMQTYFLEQIERFSKMTNMRDALTGMSACGISYQVTNAEPNVIKYWKTEYGIEGKLSF